MIRLDQTLNDLRHEIADLQQSQPSHDYDMNKLYSIIAVTRDSLQEMGRSQEELFNRVQQFERSLTDIDQILRLNIAQKVPQSGDDMEIQAKLLLLNAEILECRTAAMQLQQQARLVSSKATEIEELANDELPQLALERYTEQNRAVELEKRVKSEEERLYTIPKIQSYEIEYSIRDYMHDDQTPCCIIQTLPSDALLPIDITYSSVIETEYLLNKQEELISTPLNVKYQSIESTQPLLILAIPYIIKRSPYRENVIKIRQSNGLWIPVETIESTFDTYKEKHFVQCQLNQSSTCAVVSRLKRDTIFIKSQLSGRYVSNADPRFTLGWSRNISQNDFHMKICLQPVDLTTFTQFCDKFPHECQGLLAVGPIIELDFDEITLLKFMQFTLPILVQSKKKEQKPRQSITDSMSNLQELIMDQAFQQEQQQLIFKSMLGEDLSNERLVLLYASLNENKWHIDADIHLNDLNGHDILTTDMQHLHSRMIVARYDKQFMSLKQLQATISLFEETLNQRSATFILHHRSLNPNEICLVCCSSRQTDTIIKEIQEEDYSIDIEQRKEIIVQEGQLLELRFRGNVLPISNTQQSAPFAFNTYFPFYFETTISVLDKYSQHLSSYFYGYIQIFVKQKSLRNLIREMERRKLFIENVKQECQEADVCIMELLVSLPKPSEEIRIPIQKTLPTFTGEGILTSTLFRDMSTSLIDNEWRLLARCLGMTRIRVEAIQHDYLDDAPYYMLLTWFKRVPRSADKVLILTRALISINRWDLAQELQSARHDKYYKQQITSKEDQLKIFRIAFNRICQRDECVRIWKQLARELMLTNEDIHSIEQQYPSKQERCLKSLEHWASKQTYVDLSHLAKIIRTLGFKSLAREIAGMI